MPHSRHTSPHASLEPIAWVTRFAPLVRARGPVLDVAAGSGRHSRYFAQRSHAVTAVDVNAVGLENIPGVTAVQADLERGPWPFEDGTFAAVVVVNYLHRPLLPRIAAVLEPGGVVIYQTFAVGNEQYGRPRSPDFLLRDGELLEAFRDLRVVAYECGRVAEPGPAVIQRICAVSRPHLSPSAEERGLPPLP